MPPLGFIIIFWIIFNFEPFLFSGSIFGSFKQRNMQVPWFDFFVCKSCWETVHFAFALLNVHTGEILKEFIMQFAFFALFFITFLQFLLRIFWGEVASPCSQRPPFFKPRVLSLFTSIDICHTKAAKCQLSGGAWLIGVALLPQRFLVTPRCSSSLQSVEVLF